MDERALEEQLNSFVPEERSQAVDFLVSHYGEDLPEGLDDMNMHFHSFFSYNAENWSPSRIAWAARKAGLHAAGLCDFDVLDGLEEFLEAGAMLGLRVAVSLETRVYVREMAGADITSPGEPGVTYIMGAGFHEVPDPGTEPGDGLDAYRQGARRRNVELVDRVNARMDGMTVDYERDVLPLTPAGTATERHIVTAYIRKVAQAFPDATGRAAFWAARTGRDAAKIMAAFADLPALEELVRAGLVKRGGLGYQDPTEDTFPPVDDFIRWVKACGAIPMLTWLDGTSGGEADPGRLLDCMCGKGIAAANIIPDRNWNFPDPAKAAKMQAHLAAFVKAAAARHLPIIIGTEMNKRGLPFCDDLSGAALQPYRDVFMAGANLLVGHSLLARYAEFAYGGAAAQEEYPDIRKRNAFFAAVGALPPLTVLETTRLREMGPERAYGWFHDTIG